MGLYTRSVLRLASRKYFVQVQVPASLPCLWRIRTPSNLHIETDNLGTSSSLMQKRNPLSRPLLQPTQFSKRPHLLSSPPRPRHKLPQRTTPPGPTLTIRNCRDSIIDIEPDEPRRARRILRATRQQFENNPSAHGRHLALAPFALMRDVCDRKVLLVVDDVERGDHRRDISIVHEAEEQRPSVWALGEEIGRRVEPEPAHTGCVLLSRASAVVMQQIARVFESEEFVLREDVAPVAAAAHGGLEAAHFLHGVDVLVS